MKNIRWILLATAVLVLAILACGPSEETPAPEVQPTAEEIQPTAEEVQPTAEAQPTLPPADTPEPKPQGSTLEITNDSGMEVWYVYLSSREMDHWGEDWLENDVIGPGQTYIIEGIPEGHYDVKAEDQDQEEIEVWWDVDFAGEMTWTIAGMGSLEVINESGDTIYYLYISPSDSTTWGDDWLIDDVIDAGASYMVNNIPRGTYDIKAADSDDDSIEMVHNVDLQGQKNWTVVGLTLLPDNAVLRFEDDFSDNRNNWGLNQETENVFYTSPANGEYCILIKNENVTGWEWYETFRPDEFVAEIACYVEGAEDATCGLGFGPDGDNLYWFETAASSQEFALFLLKDGEWQDNLVEWTVSRNIDPDGTNYLSMERVRGVVYLYANGVLMGQVNSDLFPTGRIGIGGSTYNQGNVTVCMDNLRVWRLE